MADLGANDLSNRIQKFIENINQIDDRILLAETILGEHGRKAADAAHSNCYKVTHLLASNNFCDPVITLIADYRSHFRENGRKIAEGLSVKGDFIYTAHDFLDSRYARTLEDSEKELEKILKGNDPGAVKYALGVKNAHLNRLLVEVQNEAVNSLLPGLIRAGRKAIKKGKRVYQHIGIEYLLNTAIVDGLKQANMPYMVVAPRNLEVDYSSLPKYIDGPSIVTFPRYKDNDAPLLTKKEKNIGRAVFSLIFLAVMAGAGFRLYSAFQPKKEAPKADKKEESPKIIIHIPSNAYDVIYRGGDENRKREYNEQKRLAIANSWCQEEKEMHEEQDRAVKGWADPLKNSTLQMSPYIHSMIKLAEQTNFRLYKVYSPSDNLNPDAILFGFGHSTSIKFPNGGELMLAPVQRNIYNEGDLTRLLEGIADISFPKRPCILSEGGSGRIEVDSTDDKIMFFTKGAISLLRSKGIPIYLDDAREKNFADELFAHGALKEIMNYKGAIPGGEFDKLIDEYKKNNDGYFKFTQKRNKEFFAETIISRAKEGYMPIQFAGTSHMFMTSLLEPLKEAGLSYMIFVPNSLTNTAD